MRAHDSQSLRSAAGPQFLPGSSRASRAWAGPCFRREPVWIRYSLALGLLACTVYLRLELIPVLGSSAPLVPFMVPVLAAAYLCGRGPALLVTVLAPLICTALFQPDLTWTDPVGWPARVAFFLLIAGGAAHLTHRLQVSHRRLLESEARLRLATESAELGVFEWRVQQGMAVWENERMYQMFGRTPAEGPVSALPLLLAEYVHPQDGSSFVEALRQCEKGAPHFHARCRIRRKSDGQWRVLEFLGTSKPHPDGGLRILGVVHDLTDELEARKNGALLESIVASSGDAIISQTLDGTITSWNAAAHRLFGYEPQEAIGSSIRRIVPGELQDEEDEILRRLTSGDSIVHYDTDRVARDGTRLCVALTVSAIRDSAGALVGVSRIARDVTQQRRINEALAASERRFRQMADAMPHIVFVVDGQRQIQYLNRRWCEYTGCHGAERSDMQQLIPEQDLQRLDRAWQEFSAKRQAYSVEFRLRCAASNELRWFLSRYVPIVDEHGEVEMWIGTSTDVHDEKKAQTALIEADRRKNEFLAMLAHELRNPLAPILNIASILQGKASDPTTVQQMSGILKRQTTHLARLVDDLLDVARITRDKITLQRERLILQTVVDRALEGVHPSLIAKSQAVKLVSSQRPLAVDGDLVRLTQVMGNLLSNASKFSAEGTTIHVTVAEQGGEAQIRVRDQGIGIDPQALPRVFDLFMQADQSLDRSQGGLGIGLTVAKRLVELHGGRLEAHSEGSGRGSEFAVILPLVGAAHREAVGSSLSATARKVLIVDDNVDAAMSLVILLEMEGHQARAVHDGVSALREIEQFRPDSVLLDIGLPGMDGYAVADLIRQRLGAGAPQLVALSGYASEQVADGSFDAFLTKPVALQRLTEVVSAAWHSQDSRPRT